MSRIDDLMLRYEEGCLSADEMAELKQLLQEAPEARECLVAHFMLKRGMAKYAAKHEAEAKPVRRSWHGWGKLALAACVLIAVGSFLYNLDQPEKIRASILETVPGTKVIRQGKDLEAEKGLELRVGDLLVTSNGAPEQSAGARERRTTDGAPRVRIGYQNEDTVLYADVDTRFLFKDPGEGKHFELLQGAVEITAAKQPDGRPMKVFTPNAEVEVAGTRFRVEVVRHASMRRGSDGGPDSAIRNPQSAFALTRLDVQEGSVKFTRGVDEHSVLVGAGERNVATAHKVTEEGLVAHWTFDRVGKTAPDSSGNGHDATVMSSPKAVAGVFGAGLQFDGKDDFLQVPYDPAFELPNSGASISLWFKLSPSAGIGQDHKMGIFRRHAHSNIQFAVGIYELVVYRHVPPDPQNLRALVGGDETPWGEGKSKGRAIVTNNRWHHVALIWDRATAKLYLDGVLDTAIPRTKPLVYADKFPLDIGLVYKPWPSLPFFKGAMDDVRIYNRTLSAGEIADLARLGGAVAEERMATDSSKGE